MWKLSNPLPPPSPPPPPVKKIMVPSLRPAGSHGEEETVFFSPLPSPPLPFSFLSSQLSRRTHPETLATQDKRCLHITFVFRSLPWSPFPLLSLICIILLFARCTRLWGKNNDYQRSFSIIMLNTSTTSVSKVQWNPIIRSPAVGQKKRGRNNKVTALRRVSVQENVWSFSSGSQKKVAVRRGSTVLFNNNFVLHVLLTDACPLVLFSSESDL